MSFLSGPPAILQYYCRNISVLLRVAVPDQIRRTAPSTFKTTVEYIGKRSGRKVRNPRFKLWFHHQYPWESYSTSLNLSCAISTVKMFYQMTSCYSVFLLFHRLLVYFELRDLASFVDIQIEEISSWSLFSLILLSTNGCLEPPTSTQPTF